MSACVCFVIVFFNQYSEICELEFISLAIIQAGDTARVRSPRVIEKPALSSLWMAPSATEGRRSNYRELLSSFASSNKLNRSQHQRGQTSFCCFPFLSFFLIALYACAQAHHRSCTPCTLAALSAKSPPSGGVSLAPGSCKHRAQRENPNLHAKHKRSNTCLPVLLSSVDEDDRVDSTACWREPNQFATVGAPIRIPREGFWKVFKRSRLPLFWSKSSV